MVEFASWTANNEGSTSRGCDSGGGQVSLPAESAGSDGTE